MIGLAVLLSLVIGVVLGLLGGGGAILALPMLVYVLGVEAHAAIAMSLFVVGATSAVATVAHAPRVRWGIGAVFGAAAMAGAFVGGRLARLLPASVLLAGFALLMLLTAGAMLRGRRSASGALSVPRVLGLGAAVGLVSGLVGAGGGFLIVPTLTLFGGLAMAEAIATSLFVITLQSFAGFAGHIGNVVLDGRLVLLVAGAAAGGTLLGARLGKTLPPDRLRRSFAWLVLGMGLFLLGRQVWP